MSTCIYREGCADHHRCKAADRCLALRKSADVDRLTRERIEQIAKFKAERTEGGGKIGTPSATSRSLPSPREAVRDEVLMKWLDNNTTYFDVKPPAVDAPNVPVLAAVSKRIWYHATDDQLSYPFSDVVQTALKREPNAAGDGLTKLAALPQEMQTLAESLAGPAPAAPELEVETDFRLVKSGPKYEFEIEGGWPISKPVTPAPAAPDVARFHGPQDPGFWAAVSDQRFSNEYIGIALRGWLDAQSPKDARSLR